MRVYPTCPRFPGAILHALVVSALLAVPGAGVGAAALSAQDSGWNSSRVLGLVEGARDRRAVTAVDSTFQSYKADARGFVYFFIDRPDSDERTLVKADQVALEVYWKAPDKTRQRIVGLRDRKVLPTNIRYHLDHLTVVQDDFGDWIRMGDGDEVERVLHPAGPDSNLMYDYLLADSLTLRYGGAGDEVRVYEVRVRPKTPELPGFVGSMFLDRDRSAIVRMNFTFTPASYVDPYLDYIRVSLDNSLWDGRFWLPYRQEAEIRREMPNLDFLAGSIIRGRFEIRGYEFNLPLGDPFFLTRVSTVSQANRQAFPFERGLLDDLDEEGLAPSESLKDIQVQAREIVAGRALSGLPGTRFTAGTFSDWLRYNRVEDLFVGVGAQVRTGRVGLLQGTGGYSFGRKALSGALEFAPGEHPAPGSVRLFWDEIRDRGAVPGSTLLENSFEAGIGEMDYLDPWFARGVSLRARPFDAATGPTFTLGVERHRSAVDVVDGRLRPVALIEEGVMSSLGVSVPFRSAHTHGDVALTASRFRSRALLAATGGWSWETTPHRAGQAATVDVLGGAVFGDAPVQSHYYLGGRSTLPGIPYRSMVGTAFGLIATSGTVPIRAPWVGVRALASVGVVGGGDAPPVPRPSDPFVDQQEAASDPKLSDPDDTVTARATAGLGVSLFWDVLRIDRLRGIGPEGSWEWVVSISPRFMRWF